MSAHGTFVWNELMTSDTDAAAAFYGKVVGWSAKAFPMPQGGNYLVFNDGEADRGGLMSLADIPAEGVPPHWMAYIAVDDVDAACEKVGQAGGKVMQPPFDIEGVGRIAIIQDPQGAAVGLMTEAAA